jgi:carbonic anhydrase/acetyltransferase-like protein (isoleucine patch superfamily)
MILAFAGREPQLAADVYLAPTAVIIGDVVLGARSSVWFGTVVRGDVHNIRIGQRTNIQDGCVLHVTGGTHPLRIGDDVSIGHRAVVHGCTLADRVLVGMGAVVLDGAHIGADSIVGAGAVVPEGAVFPPQSVILGVPARRKRDTSPGDIERILKTCSDYLQLAQRYRAEPS